MLLALLVVRLWLIVVLSHSDALHLVIASPVAAEARSWGVLQLNEKVDLMCQDMQM
jgi:hypothetical protein